MAFDLAKAAGLDKIVSNLDTMEVVMIPLDKIDQNEKNFFSVDDVQDLMESIQVNGILQPLNLVRAGDRYRIIAGHRRFKAAGLAGLKEVPAIVLPEMSEAMEWFMLIKTNTTTRELSHAEKAEAAIRLNKYLVRMKQEGVKITGRLQEIVAKQMEISPTEFARMKVIEKGLVPEAKELWKTNKVSPSVAYSIAKASPDVQKKILENGVHLRTASEIDNYIERCSCDWIEKDCPLPTSTAEKEKKAAGQCVECSDWEKIKRHKNKGHPESCCGCCARCVPYAHGYCCPDVCTNAKLARQDRIMKEAKQKKASDEELRMVREMETLKASRIPNIAKSVLPLIERGGIQMQDIADWWTEKHTAMCPEYELDDYEEDDVALMLYPQCIEDADFSLTSFISFCDAIGLTPNDMLGYSSTRWKPYPVVQPANGQRVVVRSANSGIESCGEYIYQDGEWLHPGLDQFKMNITGVTHWIEGPEV
ncbi:MAG: ParB/RepB/Spo0J family partition protein [Oscillospiraceae bacterium]|nr:ParB/RepB/Spo0J family partition protein [Oscillospiraceae bacterium]